MARFKAEFDGQVLGWYDTLAEAEIAIAIAEDPYGPEAFDQVILGAEEFEQAYQPQYRLVG